MSHTVAKVYIFSCDKYGCTSASPDIRPDVRETQLLRAAERELIKHGWAVDYKGKQYCPEHSS